MISVTVESTEREREIQEKGEGKAQNTKYNGKGKHVTYRPISAKGGPRPLQFHSKLKIKKIVKYENFFFLSLNLSYF